jgi:hypothetical protein
MEQLRHKNPEAEFHHELELLAEKHLGGQLDLHLLPYNPIQHPDQQLTCLHNPINTETNLETINFYATAAAGEAVFPGRFQYLAGAFNERRDLLDTISHYLKDGKNIALVTNHSQLHDIAIAQGALIYALQDPELIPNNAIVISKLITRIEAFGLPATSVVGNLAHCFFSIPRTKSIFRSSIDNDVATIANTDMIRRLGSFMNEPAGKLVAIAPSGSTDERHIEDNTLRKLTMQRMSSGTAMLLNQFDYVLPVAIWLEARQDRYSISIGDIKKLHDSEAHNVMNWLAAEISHLAGVTTEYEEERLGGRERFVKLGQNVAERVEQIFRPY